MTGLGEKNKINKKSPKMTDSWSWITPDLAETADCEA